MDWEPESQTVGWHWRIPESLLELWERSRQGLARLVRRGEACEVCEWKISQQQARFDSGMCPNCARESRLIEKLLGEGKSDSEIQEIVSLSMWERELQGVKMPAAFALADIMDELRA